MVYSKEFLKRTIDVWQPYSKEKLAEADAIEITDNILNLFDCLAKLDKEQKERVCEEKEQKVKN